MKILYQIILTLLAGLVLQLFLPWWTLALGAAGVSFFFEQKGWQAFAGGFVAIFLLWLLSAWYFDEASGAIMSHRLNTLLPVPAFFLTGLVGGLVGGMAALTGKMIRWR